MSVKWTRLASGLEVDTANFENFKSLARTRKAKDRQWSVEVRVKSSPFNEADSGGFVLDGTDVGNQFSGSVRPMYSPQWFEMDLQPLSVQQLVQNDRTSSDMIVNVRESAESDGADEQNEGEMPDETEMQVEPIGSPVRTTISYVRVTEDRLQDDPGRALDFLTRRLTRKVQLKEAKDLIIGDGTAPSRTGFKYVPERNLVAQGANDIDTAVLLAIRKSYDKVGVLPTWCLMSVNMAASLYGLRTDLNGGRGVFLAGGAAIVRAFRDAWGLRVALAPKGACPDDRIFVGDNILGTRYIRDLSIEQGYLNQDFGSGITAIRARLRSAIAYEYPSILSEIVAGS